MASEIRVNQLTNRAGLGTITFANGGVQFSGITTFANGEFYVGTGATIINPSSNEFNFHTGGSNRFTINNSGVNIPTLTATTLTATTGTFSGNVSVGGVLTYEDVKNVDAVGLVTARAGVHIPDNQKLLLGTNTGPNDGEIYSSGSHVYFQARTAGQTLRLTADDVYIRNRPDGQSMARFDADGAVDLFYNTSPKFSTTNTGIDVTGAVVADDIIITGTSVVADFKSTNNNYVMGLAGNNASVPVYLGTDSSGNFLLATGSGVDERLRIDTNGRLGVRVTPKAWHTDRRVIQIGGAALSGQNPVDGQELALTNNAYYDSTNNRWEFIGADDASGITMSNGGIQFLRSPSSGSPDAALSWATSVFINDTGYLKTNSELWVGGSSPVLRWRNATNEYAVARINSNRFDLEVANYVKLRVNTDGKITNFYDSSLTVSDAQYGQVEFQKSGASNINNDWSYLSFHRVGQLAWQQGISDNKFTLAKTGGSAKNTLETKFITVDTNGQIGLGVETPGRKVHIKGPGIIKLENVSTGGWAGLEWMVSSGTNNYDAYMGLLDSNGLFFIDNNSNGIDFAITQTGLIQISEPGISAGNGGSARFQVKSTGQYDGIALGSVSSYGTIGSNGNGALVFTGNAYPANLGGGTKITHEWWSGSSGGGGPSKLMTMTSGGRVNIGEGNSGAALGALHINTPAAVGTDTALFIGSNSDNRYMTINQNPSSEQFSHMSLRYNDNARRAVLQLENPYAASTGFGTQILFQGYGEGTQAYIETTNTTVNSAQSTLKIYSSASSGIDITHDSGIYIRQSTGQRGILVQGHSSASHSSAVVTANSTSSHTNIELAYAGTKGQLNFGGHGDGSVYLQVEGGYLVGTSTLQFDYTWNAGGNGGIRATMWASHWTAGYDLYWEGFIFGDSYSGITLREIWARNSSTQGAWSITRPANNKLRIQKSAGSYGGGMYYVIMLWHPGRSMTLYKD
tara:strand:- start:2853 stop:5756 length:2904 start_codon:yes stop_codon:yes gene_type:complete